MSKRSFHLSLMQKALVLIAVPLAFELSLLVALSWLLNESDREATAAAHSKEVIAQTNAVIQRYFDISIAFIAYDAHAREFPKKALDNLVADLPEKLKHLRLLIQGNQHHEKILDRVSSEADVAMDWIRTSTIKSEEGEKLNFIEALENRSRLNHMVAQLDEIIKYEKRLQRKNPHGAAQLRLGVTSLLAIGLVSIAIALLLVLIFQRETTKRLQALMDNSVKLGKGEELSPVLEGEDEIALIDFTFHEAASALKEAARKREELEKMKKQFVAMISHDLRTPLTAVTSTLELLGVQAWGKLNEQGLAKVAMANSSLQQSIELINNLLDLEKMESGTIKLDPSEFPVMPFLEQCVNSVAPLAERQSIQIEVPQTDIFIQADEKRLARVLINFLGNALKFAPANSSIKLSCQLNENTVQIGVKDEGPGIPKDQQELIFERFHQVTGSGDKVKDGTGLGLAICKAIIEAHAGSIGVESEGSNGSLFWFAIPVKQKERTKLSESNES